MQSTCYSCQILMQIEFSPQFSKNTHIRFHEFPSSWNRFVSCGRTDRQTDMTNVIDAFRNFANAPKNERIIHGLPILITLDIRGLYQAGQISFCFDGDASVVFACKEQPGGVITFILRTFLYKIR
jgi:hypothetical protein